MIKIAINIQSALIIIILLIYLISIPSTMYAQEKSLNQRSLIKSGLRYYDLAGCSDGSTQTPTVNIDDKTGYTGIVEGDTPESRVGPEGTNAKAIYAFFVNELKLTGDQALGIMANIQQESTFNPEATNPFNGAFGIVQWLGNRKSNLEALPLDPSLKSKLKRPAYLQSSAITYKDLDVQLFFLQKEFNEVPEYKKAYEAIKTADSAEDVVYLFHGRTVELSSSQELKSLFEKYNFEVGDGMEKSGDSPEHIKETRIKNLDNLKNIFGISGNTTSSTSGSSPPTSSNASDITYIVNKANPIEPLTYEPSDLVDLGQPGQKLRKEAKDNLQNLITEASKNNLSLIPVSSYRSFSEQKQLYDDYVARDGQSEADTYSARPGYSEHQLGLSLDFNNASTGVFKTQFPAEFEWLKQNGHKFGYVLRYPEGKEDITGYTSEEWHWRYIGVEEATKYYNSGKTTLEEYYGINGGKEYSDKRQTSIDKDQSTTQTISCVCPDPNSSQSINPSPAISGGNYDEVIEKYGQIASEVGKEFKLPWETMLAQAILETGWFKSAPGNNYFGIKAGSSWSGPTQQLTTWEEVNGKPVTIVDTFRVYPELKGGFMGYGEFITQNSIYSEALKYPNDPIRYLQEIRKAGYATDSAYVDKVSSFIGGLSEAAKGKIKPSSEIDFGGSPSNSSNTIDRSQSSMAMNECDLSSTPGPAPDFIKFYEDPNLKKYVDEIDHGELREPKALVIHYTQGSSAGEDLLKYLASTPLKVGIQFNIDQDGKVYQYYPLDDMRMVYHVKDANQYAIGIEITGADGEELLSNKKQYESVLSTTKFLCDYYKIKCSDPKGDITNSPVSQTQGLLGHNETPSNDHSDPDTKIINGGTAINICTNELWTEQDRKKPETHAYMLKLRKDLGYKTFIEGISGCAK